MTPCAPSAPSNLPTAAAAPARVALVDVPDADGLGSAITLPQIEDLDADEADIDNDGVNKVKERLVGVAAAVWNCFMRNLWRQLRRGRQSGETGRTRCSYGLGSSGGGDCCVGVDGGCGEEY